MVPMLVVRKFDRLVPAATGTVKMRSLVFLVYQSIAPLTRELNRPKSSPTSYDLVSSHLMPGKNGSGEIRQPADTLGNVPHWLSGPKRDEPYRRTLAPRR